MKLNKKIGILITSALLVSSMSLSVFARPCDYNYSYNSTNSCSVESCDTVNCDDNVCVIDETDCTTTNSCGSTSISNISGNSLLNMLSNFRNSCNTSSTSSSCGTSTFIQNIFSSLFNR